MGKSSKDILSEKLEDNPFFEFTDKYFYFLRQVKSDFEKPNRWVTSTWIWSKDKKYNIPETFKNDIKELQFIRNNKVGKYQIVDINYDEERWLSLIKHFIIYLDAIELASLYKNDKDESNLYIDCDIQKSSYNLYYYDDNKETEYRISFIDTTIPKSKTQSTISAFINDNQDDEEPITLIQIDILRRYGDKRVNQIKLIENTDIYSLISKPEELLTFFTFRDILSKVIFNTFNDIINNINKIVGFEQDITDEVLNGYIKLSK